MAKLKEPPAVKISTILRIALRDGIYFVSPMWRHDTTRSRCRRMVRKGYLKKERRGSGPFGDYFKPTEKTQEGIEIYKKSGC